MTITVSALLRMFASPTTVIYFFPSCTCHTFLWCSHLVAFFTSLPRGCPLLGFLFPHHASSRVPFPGIALFSPRCHLIGCYFLFYSLTSLPTWVPLSYQGFLFPHHALSMRVSVIFSPYQVFSIFSFSSPRFVDGGCPVSEYGFPFSSPRFVAAGESRFRGLSKMLFDWMLRTVTHYGRIHFFWRLMR